MGGVVWWGSGVLVLLWVWGRPAINGSVAWPGSGVLVLLWVLAGPAPKPILYREAIWMETVPLVQMYLAVSSFWMASETVFLLHFKALAI